MLDIVNLTINGPLAFSIKGDESGKQPVVSKYATRAKPEEERINNNGYDINNNAPDTKF
jgi:hypothetical protein